MIDTKEMRRDLLKMALAAKSQGAHMGGSLSLVEIMAALYGGAMMFDPAAPQAEPRDRLILSKGHGVMAQYAAMKQVGMLTEEKLLTYKANGSPVRDKGFHLGSVSPWGCAGKATSVLVFLSFSGTANATKVQCGKQL